jgi:hypothetical protein
MFTPNWLCLNSGGFVGCPAETSRYGLRAVRPSLRKNPKALPWKLLLPDFDVMFTTPPVTPPNSALSPCDWTLNSCSESMSGSAT